MYFQIFVSCRQLLKNVHISEMCVKMRCELITKANESSVLIKIIVHNLFPEIDHHFVVYKQKRCFGYNLLSFQRNGEGHIIPNPIIKTIIINQFTCGDLSPESFFKSNPLHQVEPAFLLCPLYLLPRTMFRYSRSTRCGILRYISVT